MFLELHDHKGDPVLVNLASVMEIAEAKGKDVPYLQSIVYYNFQVTGNEGIPVQAWKPVMESLEDIADMLKRQCNLYSGGAPCNFPVPA